MDELRIQKFKKKKPKGWKINKFIPLLVLLGITLVVSTITVFSEDKKDRLVIFEGESWDMSSAYTHDWYTDSHTISFKVDFSDEYDAENNQTELPFSIQTKFEDQQLSNTVSEGVNGVYDVAVNTTEQGENGKLEVTININDGATKVFYITKDTTTPQLKVLAGEQELATNSIFYDSPTLIFSVTDTSVEGNKNTIHLSANGKAISTKPFEHKESASEMISSNVVTEDGVYELTLTSEDKAGNTASKGPFVVKVDLNAPEITVTGVENNKFYNQDQTVQIHYSDTTININETHSAIEKIGEVYPSNFEITNQTDTRAVAQHVFSTDGTYKVTAESKDGNGRHTVITPVQFTIDKTAPTVSITDIDGKPFQENQTHQTAQKLKISARDDNFNYNETTVTVKKDGERLHNLLPLVQDGMSATNVYDFNDDGKYEVAISSTDLAGNTSTEELTFTIDTQKPVIEITGITDGGYYQPGKEVSIKLSDLTLLLDKTILYITKDGEEYTDRVNFFEKLIGSLGFATHEFKEEGNYEVYVVAKDSLGREATSPTYNFTIDGTPPELTISDLINNTVYNAKKIVTISAKDHHLDKPNTKLTILKDEKEIDPETLKVEGQQDQYEFAEDGEYSIAIHAKDKAGNSKKQDPISFTIDQTKPILDISGVTNNEHYQPGQEIQFTIEDLTMNLTDQDLVVKKNGEAYSKEITFTGTKRKVTAAHHFEEEGKYEITLKSTDKANFASEIGPIVFTIDGTKPDITIKGPEEGSYVKGDPSLSSVTIEYKEYNFNESKPAVIVKRNGKDITKEFDNWNSWTNTGEVTSYSNPILNDGEYEFEVKATDKAGNAAEKKTLTFIVDNIKPTISISGAENNSYNKGEKEIVIKVEEQNFSTNKVEIKATKQAPNGELTSFDIGEWKNHNRTSMLSKVLKADSSVDGIYTIEVVSTDAAGNEGEARHLTFTMDNTKPVLSIEGVEHDHNYKSKAAKMTITDTNLSIESGDLIVTRNGSRYDVGKIELNGTKAERNFHFTEEGNYVVKLQSADKAGNKSIHDTISFIIDSTAPVLKISGINHSEYYPTNKTVTTSVEELNYSTNDVNFSVSRNGEAFNVGSWKNTGILSDLKYTFSEDGFYTIALGSKDKAENIGQSQEKSFTIDKTNPTIDITGVDDGTHYNTDKSVGIEIKDVNLDVNKVSVTKDGATYAIGGLSVSERRFGTSTAKLSHSFSREGDYVISVEAIDKAGNRFSKQMSFTIDKTKPVITPKMKGTNTVIKNGAYINQIFTPEFALDESEDTIVTATLNNGPNVAGKIPTASREMVYTYYVLARDKAGNESTLDITFTLDTSKPALTITGVLEGYFNNDLTPTVTYSDKHLDENRSSVTLNGKPFLNGTKLDKEQDYTLKANITDLANNVSSRTIVFTLDKTKPVIKFSEPLTSNYFTKDLLPSLLIEDMSAYDIISQTLNGEPYELGEPITTEGKHVLFFEVKDKAGNIQQLSVEFIIDKTKPKVLFDGVEKGKVYYDSKTVQIRLENPFDYIKEIYVNGKLFDGEIIEEDGYKIIKFNANEKMKYEVKVLAYDEAGNEISDTFSFEIKEKGAITKFFENKLLVIGAVTVLLGGIAAGGTTVYIRRREGLEDIVEE
ncbi:hypothetical protein FZW96_04470 [Bacillus sp. BGMRC 2118]|nr:hypothetical protein FZW96_04470 [Bacillus sp. BGMRC 2118]